MDASKNRGLERDVWYGSCGWSNLAPFLRSRHREDTQKWARHFNHAACSACAATPWNSHCKWLKGLAGCSSVGQQITRTTKPNTRKRHAMPCHDTQDPHLLGKLGFRPEAWFAK